MRRFNLACYMHVAHSPAVRGAIIKSAAMRKNPSSGAVVSEVIATQTAGRPDNIFNRRPAHLQQPPVDIWSPLLSGLRRVLSQSLDDVRFALKELAQANVILQGALAHYPNKSERQGVLSTIPFGGRLLSSRETISANGRSYSPDRAKFVVWESAPLHSLSVVYCIEEIENDLGAGSSDPIRQAECHYAAVCSGYGVCNIFSLRLAMADTACSMHSCRRCAASLWS